MNLRSSVDVNQSKENVLRRINSKYNQGVEQSAGEINNSAIDYEQAQSPKIKSARAITELKSQKRSLMNPIRSGKLESLKFKFQLQHKNLKLLVEHNNIMSKVLKGGKRSDKIMNNQGISKLERDLEKSSKALQNEIFLIQ